MFYIREILKNIGMDKTFLGKMPKARETKVKVIKQDFIKLNSVCTARIRSGEITY